MDMKKACVICGGDETSGEHLLEAPCQRHWVCTEDVGSFFERATESESLYPPKCCGQLFLLDVYEAFVPFEVSWAFQMKAQGEYAVLAKHRVYCANPACSKFLSPATHVKDPSSNTSYAVCQDAACRKSTCTTCKTLIDGVDSHTCEQNVDYQKFKQTVTEKGFQECPSCASTVELADACNHITCECGTQFCYICGDEWRGMHGCPHYGPAVYDEEGYNQDGFHRTTGLNRLGRTHREQVQVDREENGESDDEGDDEEDEDPNAFHPVLQHVEPGLRAAFVALPHEEREMFLVNLQIQLFEERGITFGFEDVSVGERNSDNEEDDVSVDNDSGADEGERDVIPGQAGDHEETIEVGQSQNAEREENSSGGNEPMVANMSRDTVSEVLPAAKAEVMQANEDSIEDGSSEKFEDVHVATKMQSNESLEAPDDATLAQAIQNVVDGAELEMSVEQYLTRLLQAYPGNTAEAIHEYDITAVDRPMTDAELAHTLQRMRTDVYHEAVSRDVVHEALDILYARFPANENISLFRQNFSNLTGKEQGDNDESSSATSPDEDRPATPMDIDSVNGQEKDEREHWEGLPGG